MRKATAIEVLNRRVELLRTRVVRCGRLEEDSVAMFLSQELSATEMALKTMDDAYGGDLERQRWRRFMHLQEVMHMGL